ncbi:MAG TPA: LamG-like jellyroll fold domain-containing protein [Methylomirabilota bacterium]|nr:LamG-like jellyroll fold domain-containing protein [Methylomirabilota bacterium]
MARRDGTGLKAEYYANTNFAGKPAVVRTDKVVYFHWIKDRDALPEGISGGGFSVRWSGQVEAAVSDVHRFTLETITPWVGEGWGTQGKPNLLRIRVGGELVVDTTQGRTMETTHGICGEVKLRAGRRYDLVVEASYSGNAVAKLCWETPMLDRRTILPAFLHPTTGSSERAEAVSRERPALLAEFTFDRAEGSLLWSRAGGSVFGRLTGNTRLVRGRKGKAVEFSARGEFEPALLPIDEELRLPETGYSVSFWFKTASPDMRLCETKRYSSYNNRWSDHMVSLRGGKLRFELRGDNALETAERLNDGKWHHVLTSVRVGGQELHVDGKLVGRGALSKRTKITNRLGLDIGPGGGDAEVVIDDVRVELQP